MDEQPLRIRIAPADPELQAHLDQAMYQPSMLPGTYPTVLGDQRPLFEGGMDRSPRRKAKPADEGPTLF